MTQERKLTDKQLQEEAANAYNCGKRNHLFDVAFVHVGRHHPRMVTRENSDEIFSTLAHFKALRLGKRKISELR